jgi:hypothetical protein
MQCRRLFVLSVATHDASVVARIFRNVFAMAGNLHNQILAVGIQIGLVGIAALVAMWTAHLALFRTGSFAAWIGLVVVIQNIVGSLFNSHLFDFTHGAAYVIGVGIAGGIVLKESLKASK